ANINRSAPEQTAISATSNLKFSKGMRSWRVPLLVALTFFVIMPFWHLGRSPSYTGFYDHLSDYFEEDDYWHQGAVAAGAVSSTTEAPVTEKTSGPPALQQDVIRPPPRPAREHSAPVVSSQCKDFPDTEGIVVVMKTGATESYSKIPTQLLTSLQCIPNVLLFSDLNQQIGEHKLHDVLDRVDETIRKTHKEFKLYDAQRNCHVSQQQCTLGLEGAWDLDKYKFLNMVERAWEHKPNMDWYVFAEADTYIVWPNLVHWLRERAPEGDVYVGSAAMAGGKAFAHGGSGYVMSGQLIRKMVEGNPDLAAKYDEQAPKNCCGDYLVALAAEEVGTRMKQAHPMFNGEKPSTFPYGLGHWCEPLLTMHHMSPEEVSRMWQFEQRREMASNLLIKDTFHEFVEPHLAPTRQDWDNMSDDLCFIGPDDKSQARASQKDRSRQKPEEEKTVVERRAHMSPAACANICESQGLDVPEDEYNSLNSERMRGELLRTLYDERQGDAGFHGNRTCFQWRYNRGACCVSRTFKLGGPKAEPQENWMSGWFVRGIEDWVKTRGQCKGAEWRVPWHL
ncbi:unnamed protein product, partial [Clonostachys byssicola]